VLCWDKCAKTRCLMLALRPHSRPFEPVQTSTCHVGISREGSGVLGCIQRGLRAVFEVLYKVDRVGIVYPVELYGVAVVS
jgi:hypothetical protein